MPREGSYAKGAEGSEVRDARRGIAESREAPDRRRRASVLRASRAASQRRTQHAPHIVPMSVPTFSTVRITVQKETRVGEVLEHRNPRIPQPPPRLPMLCAAHSRA